MIAYKCPLSSQVRRGRPNKALHLTKRVGVPASQAVVEARFAGERRCTGAGRCAKRTSDALSR